MAAPNKDQEIDQGVLSSSILLMTLGEEVAAEVFKYLGPKEVHKISLMMATLEDVRRDQVRDVLQAFIASTQGRGQFGASDEYLRSVLTKALGPDRAATLLDRILNDSDNSGIESLKWMDPDSVAELIRNEHPQIIATILVHLEPDQVSSILNRFVERQRNDVLLRIATLDGIQPIALRELNDVLLQLLSGTDRVKKAAAGGEQMTAEILNYMGGDVETSAINAIRERDPELAQRIQDKMFTFEDLLAVDDRGMQAILREVPGDKLIIAMKGTSEELRNKFFRNMSQRAAEVLREDFATKGAVKVSEVESEQREILKTVRKLADQGTIVIAVGGGEGLLS